MSGERCISSLRTDHDEQLEAWRHEREREDEQGNRVVMAPPILVMTSLSVLGVALETASWGSDSTTWRHR